MTVTGQQITGSDENTTDSAGIRGGTDATIIGNIGDNLKVTTTKTEGAIYSAAVSGITVAATPTDVFTITGGAGKTIRVLEVELTGTTTSGSPVSVNAAWIKRSTANSGGTRVATTIVPLDSNNAAPVATVGHYTANPTLGTAVGAVLARRVTFNASGLTGAISGKAFDVPVVLRGTSQQLSLNLNSTTVTGNILSATIIWEEI